MTRWADAAPSGVSFPGFAPTCYQPRWNNVLPSYVRVDAVHNGGVNQG